MIRNLSQKQLDVMKILWDAGTPLVASDIVKAESSMNINTVQASLRVLLKENLVEIADIVYSGTVLSRSYRPLISRDVYFNAEYKNIIGNSSTSAMIATFIEQEEDISELERIEELIRKRMKELEEAQKEWRETISYSPYFYRIGGTHHRFCTLCKESSYSLFI